MSELTSFLAEHWMLVGAIVVVATLIITEEIKAWLFDRYVLAAETAAVSTQRGIRTLDIRSRALFSESHLENAEQVSYDELMRTPEHHLKAEQAVLIYCQDGSKSTELAQFLREKHGFKAFCIEGGLNAWIKEGFTLSR